MLYRFTDKAIQAIVLAQEEVRRLKQNFVGTEQVFLGLIAAETDLAAQVLQSFNLSLDQVRSEVAKGIDPVSSNVEVEIPFTAEAKQALQLSLEEAHRLGHYYIDAPHLLLGLLQADRVVRLLQTLDVDASAIRIQVLQELGNTVWRSPPDNQPEDAETDLSYQPPYSQTQSAVSPSLDHYSPFARNLVNSGYVSFEQMQDALGTSRKLGRPITEVLELITGQSLPPALLRQFKQQQLFELKLLYGIELFDPETHPPSILQIKHLINTHLPIDLCRRHRVIPISLSDGEPASILVAVVDPDDLQAQDDLNQILRSEGLEFQRQLILLEDYQQLIASALD